MDTLGKNLYEYIFKIANKKLNINKNDLIVNGLLKCSKCGDFKQKKIIIQNESFIVPKLCNCAKIEHDRIKREELEQKQIQKINILKKNAFKNKNYYHYKIENSDNNNKYMLSIVKKYVLNWNECKKHGIGLFLYGNVGVGKTYYACCIANILLESGISVIFTSISELINQMSIDFGANKESILNRIKKTDLIIIDDFQIKKNSEYEVDIVYEIVNTLYENSKPTIITTNLDINDFKNDKMQYQKIYDRIAQMCTAILVEANINKRRIKSLERKEIIQKIIKEK